MVKVIALVSHGRHPKSNAYCRDSSEAAAVELGLRLAGGDVELLHAGDVSESVLREYLGMGVAQLNRIETPAGMDWVADAVAYLRQAEPDIVLTGVRSRGGVGTGIGPYRIADALGMTMLAEVASIVLSEQQAVLDVQRSGGRVETYRAPLPLLATVSAQAVRGRASVHRNRQKGQIILKPSIGKAVSSPVLTQSKRSQPARRLRVDAEGMAADPMRSLLELGSTSSAAPQMIAEADTDEAAQEIVRFIESKLGRSAS